MKIDGAKKRITLEKEEKTLLYRVGDLIGYICGGLDYCSPKCPLYPICPIIHGDIVEQFCAVWDESEEIEVKAE